MKDLGLPLGFLNTTAMLVDEDRTFKLNQTRLNLCHQSSFVDASISNPKKHHNRKRGKKKVCRCKLRKGFNLFLRFSYYVQEILEANVMYKNTSFCS